MNNNSSRCIKGASFGLPLACFAMLIWAGLSPQAASADQINWTGKGADANYTTGGNWNGGSCPPEGVDNWIAFGPGWEITGKTVNFGSDMHNIHNGIYVNDVGPIVFTADEQTAGISLTDNATWNNIVIANNLSDSIQDATLTIADGTYNVKAVQVGKKSAKTGYYNQTGGTVNASGNSLIGTSGGTGVMHISGGSFNSLEDMLIGDGGSATVTVDGTGTLSVSYSDTVAKWMKLGNSGSGDSVLNLNAGGTVKVWHIERITGSGTASINFNGGTLVALGVDTNYNKYLIGNIDAGHTVEPTVNILSGGGTIDVLSNNITVNVPVIGVGTITKNGSGTLSFAKGFIGGLSIAEGAVTIPDVNIPSSGNVYIAAKADGTFALSDFATAISGKTVHLEDGAIIRLTGVTLDFSSADEQKILEFTDLKFLGNSVSEDTNLSSYVVIEGAAVPHKLVYKVSDKGLYAVKVTDANIWKGEDGDDWSSPKSWTYAVPIAASTVSFAKDAVVSLSSSIEVAGLTASGDVEFVDNIGTLNVVLGSVTCSGSIAKSGVGLTTFTGAFTGVGFTVKSGVAAVPLGSTFGAVTIGEAAALVVDIGSTSLTANTALNLFSATSLSANSADITDAMLLRGSAANYTFSYESQTVKANITAVHNRTANVRVWHSGAANQYLDNDQGTYYGNTPPNGDNDTGLCDAVVVCETATGHGWGGNTGKFRQLLVRGCTFTLDSGNSSPGINAQYIGGNGTLILNNHGFKRAWGPVVVSDGLTIDVRNTTTASWFGAEGEGDDDSMIMNVNADVYCTNGYLIARVDSSINGKLVVGGSNSKVEFAAGSHFGSNMQLVIADGMPSTFTNDSGETIPSVVVKGGSVAYSALPDTTASSYQMSGGVLTMTVTGSSATAATPVEVSGGKVVIDASTTENLAENTVISISGISLPDGSTPSDYIQMSGTTYYWSIAAGETPGTYLATANVNTWQGQDQGSWSDAGNWTCGLPASDQAVRVSSASVIMLDDSVDVAELIVNGNLTLTNSNSVIDADFGAVSGDGALTKVGDGTLSVSGVPSGALTVSAGTLVIPSTSSPSSVTVANGGLLLVDVSGLSLSADDDTAINLGGIVIPEGETNPARFVGPKGARAIFTFSQSQENGSWTLVSARLASDGAGVYNYWMAGQTSTSWATAGNWSCGSVPNSTSDTAVFPSDARVLIGEDLLAYKVLIADGHTLKVHKSSGWPAFRVKESRGGTINLSSSGLRPIVGGGTADIYSDVETDPTVAGQNQDCWFEGQSSDECINIWGTLCSTNSDFRINNYFNLYGTLICGRSSTNNDNNKFTSSTVKDGGMIKVVSNGKMTFKSTSTLESGATLQVESGTAYIEGSATLDGNVLASGGSIVMSGWCSMGSAASLGGTSEGSITLQGGLNMEGKLTGSPTIVLEGDNGIGLKGDDSAFSGAISGASQVEFYVKDAGSENAVFTNSGSKTWNFKHGAGDAVKLGAFNVVGSETYYWVENSGAVIEIGNKGDSAINGPGSGGPYTIRKVNASTSLTLGPSATLPSGSALELVAGTLNVPVSIFDGDKTFSVSAGNIVIDGSSLTGLTAGSKVVLRGLTLPENADPNDIFALENTGCAWSFAADTTEANTYVATATCNTWKGGESGAWNAGDNWTMGVPVASQIVRVAGDAEIALPDSVEVAGFVADGSVKFIDNVGTLTAALGSVTGTGSIAKSGVGLTTFTGTFTDVGFTVESGVAAVPMGAEFGAVTIGKTGMLVVDITGATLVENGELPLFSCTAIETSGDKLEDVMVLTGPAGLYTFDQSQSEGKTMVKAVVSRVFSGYTAKPHVWQGTRDQYLDQANSYYDSSKPGDCDSVIVFSDTTCHGYATNTGKFRHFYVRGAVVKLDSGNSSPGLFAQYIGGNGTLILDHHGLRREWGPVVVSDGLTLDIRNTGAASWFGAEGEGDDNSKIMNVNADVYCTNGYLIARIDSSINGKLVVGGSNSKVVFNEGARIGSNMQLVIADGMPSTFTNDSGETIPSVVIKGGSVAYSALPDTTASSYQMTGGVLTMTLEEACSTTAKKVNFVGGRVLVDVQNASASAGDEFELSSIVLGDNIVVATDVRFINYGELDWDVSVADGGRLIATVGEMADTVWVGGSDGVWNVVDNWNRGVPDANRKARFTNDVVVTMTASSVPNIAGVVLNTDSVTFKKGTGSADKIHVGPVAGTGTLTLDKWGLAALSGQTVEANTPIVLTNGAWLGDWQWSGVLQMRGKLTVQGVAAVWKIVEFYGPIEGDADATIQLKQDDVRFKGDNSKFYGTFDTDGSKTVYFDTAQSGFSNAKEVKYTGSLWLWLDSGTITFGGDFRMTSTGARGINRPYNCGEVTLVLGNNNGNVVFDGSNTYEVFERYENGDWPGLGTGSEKFTLRKVGSGSFINNMTAPYKLELAGGTTTINNNYVGATPIQVASGASIARASSSVSASGIAFAAGSSVDVKDEDPASWTFASPAATGYLDTTVKSNGTILDGYQVGYANGVLSVGQPLAIPVEGGSAVVVTVPHPYLAVCGASGTDEQKIATMQAANANGISGVMAYLLGYSSNSADVATGLMAANPVEDSTGGWLLSFAGVGTPPDAGVTVKYSLLASSSGDNFEGAETVGSSTTANSVKLTLDKVTQEKPFFKLAAEVIEDNEWCAKQSSIQLVK